MNPTRIALVLCAVLVSACVETPVDPESSTTNEGSDFRVERVTDLSTYKLEQRIVVDERLECTLIDFADLPGGSLAPASGAALTTSALGVSIDFAVVSWTDAPNDCGTGRALVFDTSVPSGPDPDLVAAGQSVVPNLGNVATHQSCEGPISTPNDADVDYDLQFTFPNGDWRVRSFTALDQEGVTQSEFIALRIDVATDGTQIGITNVAVDNESSVEVVGVGEVPFTSTLDFGFHGSGAIDDIEVCKVVERGGEGCTPGYWRQSQHFGNWPVSIDYTVAEAFDGFCDVDDVSLRRPESGSVCGLTLLEAVQLRGGGVNALMRHAAAAWLNAGSTVDFYYAQSEVEDMTEAALMSGMYEATKDGLEEANEAGCPLGRAELD